MGEMSGYIAKIEKRAKAMYDETRDPAVNPEWERLDPINRHRWMQVAKANPSGGADVRYGP